MIHIADIVIVVILGAAAYVGFRMGAIRQLSATLGLISGLFISAFVYTRLAFLAEQSWLRGIVLVCMLFAITLLSYDVLRGLGGVVERRLPMRKPGHKKINRLVGLGVGAVGALFVVWLAAIVPSRIGPSVLRASIAQSVILSSINATIPPPSILQAAAYVTAPFGAPTVFTSTEPTFLDNPQVHNVEQAYADLDAAIAGAAPSIVKVSSWGCGSATVGSGFLAANQYIVTNAHVVAGADRITVLDGSAVASAAYAVLFDPGLDVAVLFTETPPSGEPLAFRADMLSPGSLAAVLGYPNGGDFAAGDATVLQDIQAVGTDIYGRDEFTRHVYAVRSSVVPGNSGGPLIDTKGAVAGLVFGHSNTQNRTGYAITADQIVGAVADATKTTQKVSTGTCGAQ